MQNVLLSTLPIEELKSELSETIKRELQAIISSITPPAQQAEFITRKETAKLLGVSLPTLNDWQKQGIIQGYRIASRVRYKRAEVETAFVQIKTGKTSKEENWTKSKFKA